MTSPTPNVQNNHKMRWQMILRRIASSALILLGIIILTLLGLLMAEQGRRGVATTFLGTASEVLQQAAHYLFSHPENYVWHKETIPAWELVQELFINSAGLLLLSLALAIVLGVWLGITAALSKRKIGAPFILLTSILGVSVPSFLLAMLLWVAVLKITRLMGLSHSILPPHSFGWDNHLVLPVLVLAARPFAQIMQVTYVTLSDVMSKEYIRSARAKGASRRQIVREHALPNILNPVLTTAGTSLRYSLASLPVVESFFLWPGLGSAILDSIRLDIPFLITDLTVSLGLLFILVNLGLEFLYPILDPRLRDNGQETAIQHETTLRERWQRLLATLKAWIQNPRPQLFPQRKAQPETEEDKQAAAKLEAARKHIDMHREDPSVSDRKHILRSALRNPLFLIGVVLVIGWTLLIIYGPGLTDASPYDTNRILTIEGVITGPPFEPSSVFPWGSDVMGRDVQALVLHGGRQTLTLALFATIARVLLGVILGMIAGWWRGSWFDRLLNSLINVWAAFPVTIFAMLLILGLGIQQGMKVFIIAFCVVGWGEIAQYVRGQVIAEKPKLHIEAAHAVGARSGRILNIHILPHLLPSIVVLAVLEMGSVLMLLAELGFLNIFLGGGFRVESTAGIYYYSDIPEWGALLSNIRNWWRSFGWMAWYPGLFFFLSIFSLNILGEGLRRFLEASRISLNRFINRYTAAFATIAIVVTILLFRSQTPLGLYNNEAKQFDADRAMADIAALTSPEFEGRETGTDGNRAAAEYIAGRMEEIGLFPGGEKETFIQGLYNPRFHLVEVPRLEFLDENGDVAETLSYRKDFVEFVDYGMPYPNAKGQVVGLALAEGYYEKRIRSPQELFENIILVRDSDLRNLDIKIAAGILVISEDPDVMDTKLLYPHDTSASLPVITITPELADRILASCGSSLAGLDAAREALGNEEMYYTSPGTSMYMEIIGAENTLEDKYINVIGYIPGTGALMGEGLGRGLDNQVIIINAYFDGLGTGPDGTFYPGANDNASGVATMLEMARVMMEGEYQPKKTVVFIANSGGQRRDMLAVNNAMNAKTGFGLLTVEAILELSGTGAGTGDEIFLGPGSSYRLVTLYEDAAGRTGAKVTTRGRGTHFGRRSFNFGDPRTAMSAFISWEGSDWQVNTVNDTIDIIDPDKLQQTGETTLLTLLVLSREVDY